LKVQIFNTQKDLPIDRKSIRNMVASSLDMLHINTNEVIIHFVTLSKICKLHAQFFDDPSPTDCISFPYTPSSELFGEVFICPKVACDYASQHGIDPQRELALYLVHGLLHLAGYDDINPADRRKMRAMEKKLLAKLFP
jgi:probable rRNA maturation factor